MSMTIKKKKLAPVSIETSALMTTAGASLITDLALTLNPTSLVLATGLGLVTLTGLFPNESNFIFRLFAKIYRVSRFPGILLVAGLALYFVSFIATPAQAQFLNQTQSWMVSVFPQAQAFAPIIFNAIRLLLVLFIIFKAFQAVQAARNDEEWQNLVKTPLVIIVLVAITDITVGFITGAGGTGTQT
jgi:hypothetical protein